MTQTMGREDWANDPELSNNAGRATRAQEMDDGIAAWCAAHDAAFLLDTLSQAQVPSSKIFSIKDIVEDAQYQARGMIETITLDDGTKVSVPGVVPKLSRTPGRVPGRGPLLGEHNGEILKG